MSLARVVSLSLYFNGHFSRWTLFSRYQNVSILGFIEAREYVNGTAISRAKLQSNHHHQQTNTQFFTDQMSFLSPNQQCQSTEGRLASVVYQLKPTSVVEFEGGMSASCTVSATDSE